MNTRNIKNWVILNSREEYMGEEATLRAARNNYSEIGSTLRREFGSYITESGQTFVRPNGFTQEELDSICADGEN